MNNIATKIGATKAKMSELRLVADLLVEQLQTVVEEYENAFNQLEKERSQFKVQLQGNVLPIQGRRRRSYGRLGQGIKTPAEDFFKAILSVLKNRGGSVARSHVMEDVEVLMKDRLNQYDFARHRSNDSLSWQCTVDRARQLLINNGLMKATSRKAIWEITEAGRKWLEQK